MRTAWLIAGLCASAAAAQQPTGLPSPLIIDRSRADRVQPQAAPRPAPAGAARIAPKVAAAEDAAVTIKGIRFEGTKVPGQVARAAERFVGQAASKANLEALANAMSKAYETSDVALYTVLVPEQDLSAGVVRVIVAEGFIEGVRLTGDAETHERALVKAYADRLIHERPLTRATLERYLSLIRDVPGLTVDAQLLQGANPGGVQMTLALKQKRLEFNGGIDNRTSDLLGDWQSSATLSAYGLLREGDYTELAGSAALDFHDYVYGSITHSTPIGQDGMRLAISGGYLKTRPDDTPIRGEAVIGSLTLSYPLIRSYASNLTLSGSLDAVDSDNAAFGNLIASEHSRAARIAAAYSHAKARHVASLGVTVSQGLDVLHARVMEPLSEATFTKANVRATFDRALGKKVAVRLRAAGQYSDDRLPAVERFALGGADFGRAFETALLTGDRGYAGLAELAWRPVAAKAFQASELYGFVDGGRVDVLRRGPFAGAAFDLASAGGGVRLAWADKAAIEVEAARAIDRPYAGYGDGWRVSLGWRLSLH